MGYTKKAIKTDQSGNQYVDCECGQTAFLVDNHIACACGIRYDSRGWIEARPSNSQKECGPQIPAVENEGHISTVPAWIKTTNRGYIDECFNQARRQKEFNEQSQPQIVLESPICVICGHHTLDTRFHHTPSAEKGGNAMSQNSENQKG